MKKVFIIVLSLFILQQSLVAMEQEDLKKHFLNKIDEVVHIVQIEKDKSIRNSKIIDTLNPTFDFVLMAKLSLGKNWKTLTNIQRKEFVKEYVNRMKNSYSSKLDSYSNQKIEVSSTKQPKKNRIELVTNLLNNNEKLEISYKFYLPSKKKENKDKWLIYDVVILGVSILKTDKAQFSEFLQNNSIEDLIVQLKKS